MTNERASVPSEPDADCAAPGRPSPPLLGRDDELAHLQAMLDRARAGRGGCTLLRGEPGVGKTALLDATTGAAGDFRTLRISGTQSESALAFAGLLGLLAPLRQEISELPGSSGAALRAALGFAAGEADALAYRAGLLVLLARAATHQPLLIVADDVHWFDPESLQALAFAVRRLPDDPVVCLLAARDAELRVAPGGIPELSVGGLPRLAARELLALNGRRLSPRQADRLWEDTDGNALALVELPAHTDERMPSRPIEIGRRLQEAYWDQVAELDDPAQRALLLAAAGHGDPIDTIAGALDSAGLSLSALAVAEDRNLITITDSAVRWRHPLVRSAVYQHAAAPDRRDAHARLAAAADTAGATEQRTWHRAAAAFAPDREVAADLETVAGETARRGAWTTAAAAYARAAELSPGGELRSHRQLLAAEYEAMLGHSDTALEFARSATSATSDPRVVARAERINATVLLLRGSPGAWHGRLVAAAEAVAGVDRPMAAQLMIEACVPHLATGDGARFVATARRAMELAEPLGGVIEACAASMLGAGLMVFEQDPGCHALLDGISAVMHEPELWRVAPEIAGLYAECQFVAGHFGAAAQLLDEIVDGARRSGAVRTLYYPLANRAIVGFRLGDWSAALADAQEAVDLCTELDNSAMRAYAQSVLAMIEGGLGHSARAVELAEEGIELAHRLGSYAITPWASIGVALSALGDDHADEAVRALDRIEPVIDAAVQEPGLYQTAPIAIEAYLRIGDLAAARAQLERLRTRAGRSAGSWTRAVLARCEGLLGTDEQLDDRFGEALAIHAHLPLPFERAWTELCFGERLRQARRRQDARRQLSRAAATFRMLGAESWQARAERELTAAGGRRTAAVDRSPWSQLTAGETRVVRQIVEGSTYDEAAAALFLSPRTIEAHLRRIYRKLGVRSRTELTRILTSAPRATSETP
jgi:DNA-binding CsgD family transcriptional regulator